MGHSLEDPGRIGNLLRRELGQRDDELGVRPGRAAPATVQTSRRSSSPIAPCRTISQRRIVEREYELDAADQADSVSRLPFAPTGEHPAVPHFFANRIRELVERKARTAPIQANRVLQRISAMLSFAVDQDWIESNPAWRIQKPGRERSRDRVLTREELRDVWAALHETEPTNSDGMPKPRLSQTLNDVLIVMLLTARRRGEVCTMRW
jgi:integrase